jgi:hypothetical protein
MAALGITREAAEPGEIPERQPVHRPGRQRRWVARTLLRAWELTAVSLSGKLHVTQTFDLSGDDQHGGPDAFLGKLCGT